MSAPNFTILTQQELTIDLSRPAMAYIVRALDASQEATIEYEMEGELDNFRNTLLNLLERSEPEPGNLDLIGG